MAEQGLGFQKTFADLTHPESDRFSNCVLPARPRTQDPQKTFADALPPPTQVNPNCSDIKCILGINTGFRFGPSEAK